MQFTTAFLAFRLIRETGHKLAWGMIAVALILMGFRRSISWVHAVSGDHVPVDLHAELVALLISVLMLVGVSLIGRLFRSAQENQNELRRKNAELERSNAELEAFAYVASHDLREPLRNVTSFSAMLEKKISGKLDDESRTYLNFIQGGAIHMNHLILDLLDYSRVGQAKGPVTRVPTRQAVAAALHALQAQIADSGAEISLQEDMPTLQGNRSELERIFVNLLSNALKYRAAERPLSIAVACARTQDGWTFMVRDNGIGIETGKGYEERIFGLFQRLHHREEFGGGTGIGLSICRKIIERNGGKIWVESKLGHGSTFFFSWPSHD